MCKYLSAVNISYRFPNGSFIFKNINLSVSSETKAALIGKNGVGKSTLLKILTGELKCSDGELEVRGSVAYLPQHTSALSGTVAEVMGISEIIHAVREIERGDVRTEYFELADNNWEIEARAHRELARYGLTGIDLSRDIRTFSGGEVTKILFTAIFMSSADIILFDEPTNNIDYSTKEQFIESLLSCNKGVLAVTHDRELLSRLNRIYELAESGLRTFGGNYDFYKEEKRCEMERKLARVNSLRKSQKGIVRKQQELQRKTAKSKAKGEVKTANNKYTRVGAGTKRMQAENSQSRKQTGLAEKSLKLNSELQKAKKDLDDNKYIKIKLADYSDAGTDKTIVNVDNIKFDYDGCKVINGLSMIVRYGERIAVKGDNGSGKSTLIRLIAGELTPVSGHVDLHASPVYLDQRLELLDPEKTIFDNFLTFNPEADNHTAHDVLAKFLFKNENANKFVKELSGGELLKATLACVLGKSDLELLVMDEPTNNLDIESVEIMENALNQYSGSLIIVSHDEYFLNNINITENIEL